MNSIERFSQGLGVAALSIGWLAPAVSAMSEIPPLQMSLPAYEAVETPWKSERSKETDSQAADVLQQAAQQAEAAESLARRAASAAEWDAVMARWLEAIALAQSIPPDSPARILAQRQLRSYVQGLIAAQRENEQASPFDFPSLGSDLFDVQLAGYLSYVATVGTPDILIVGSSRALQGIDPQVMQQTLAEQGYPGLKVYNFSVNGATAQVVNFVLSELLPEPLPDVIVWGDGSRAFNEGRRDRTWESVVASAGYQAVRTGENPANGLIPESVEPVETVEPVVAENDDILNRLRATAARPSRTTLPDFSEGLDALGFSAVGDRFSPQTYYQQFPQVSGRYDGAYQGFRLNGAQRNALVEVADFVTAQGSQLFFVNLPLSDSYLDSFRQQYERQFQQFLQAQSAAHGFEVIDLLTQWRGRPALFADPSHVNREGAAAIAVQLAQHPSVLGAIRAQMGDVGDREIGDEETEESLF